MVLVYQFNPDTTGLLVDVEYYFVYGCLVSLVVRIINNERPRCLEVLSLHLVRLREGFRVAPLLLGCQCVFRQGY